MNVVNNSYTFAVYINTGNKPYLDGYVTLLINKLPRIGEQFMYKGNYYIVQSVKYGEGSGSIMLGRKI